MGDVLLATPALRALVTAQPDADITFLTTAPCLDVVAAFAGRVELVGLPLRRLTAGRLARALLVFISQRGLAAFDLCYVLQNHPLVVLAAHLAAKKTVYFYNPVLWYTRPMTWIWRHWRRWRPRGRYIACRYLDMVEAGEPRDPKPIVGGAEGPFTNAESAKAAAMPFVLCFPGGGRNLRDSNPYKRWPAARWLALLQKVKADWPTLNLVLAGSREDDIFTSSQLEELRALEARLVFGQTDIPDLMRLIQRARLVVTTDSLPLHLAVGLGMPTVALFGPSDEQALLPPACPHVTVVAANIPCRPCYANSLFPGCPFSGRCMEALTVEKVVQAVNARLEATGA